MLLLLYIASHADSHAGFSLIFCFSRLNWLEVNLLYKKQQAIYYALMIILSHLSLDHERCSKWSILSSAIYYSDNNSSGNNFWYDQLFEILSVSCFQEIYFLDMILNVLNYGNWSVLYKSAFSAEICFFISFCSIINSYYCIYQLNDARYWNIFVVDCSSVRNMCCSIAN